ncbi:MAG: HD domain-containing protein, partial [Candidatus Moraniibacteriota bacterium]
MPSPIAPGDIFSAAAHPFASDEQKFIMEAYHFSEKAHRGQKRKSGQDYISHCLHVAEILAEIGMDDKTIVASLLHDVPEDTE